MSNVILDALPSLDVSIQYQVQRDLLDNDDKALQKRIHQEGWGKRYLDLQNTDGHWGLGWYRPKWICTHYTLLIFKYLNPIKEILPVKEIITDGLEHNICPDGGISFWKGYKNSDICVNGMFLNYASYFINPDVRFHPLIDNLLKAQMGDGGWNCRYKHQAVHSSFHTTLSVLEGLWEYRISGGDYRLKEILQTESEAIEFLLIHYLYLSHRNMEIVDPKMTLFSYPTHWYYDILKALVHFADRKIPWDDRLQPAIKLMLSKQTYEGWWLNQNRHAGKAHFHVEKVGHPSAWNTLRALKVIRQYKL